MKKIAYYVLIIISVSFLTACGGGGGGSTSSSTSATTTSITGTAATGLAIAGGAVDVNCVAGTAPSSTTGSDGAYLLSVSNGTLPCIIRVTIPTTGQKLYSIIEPGSNTANITPLSHLVSHVLFNADSETVFSNFPSYSSLINVNNISSAQTKVAAALVGLGIEVAAYDLLKAKFIPTNGDTSGDVLDQKLDQLMLALTAAEKSLTSLATTISSPSTSVANAATVTAAALGPSASSFSDCPYVRGGNYWTFFNDGTNLIEWAIDVANPSAMTIRNVSTNASYSISKLRDESNAIVPCAYTFSYGTSTITSYMSKSGVFAWKQLMNTGLYYFGLGVPKQALASLANSNYAGSYPALLYVSELSGGRYLTNTGAAYFTLDASGNTKFAECDLRNGTPSCGTPSASNSNNVSCGANSNGTISCASSDGQTRATLLLMTNQQQPTLFMLYSMTISGNPVTALVVATKANTLGLPTVGSMASKSTSWYLERLPKNNANTNWTFASGDTSFGASTTVTAVNTTAKTYSTQSGSTFYSNTPTNGMYWLPSYISNGSNSNNVIGLKSNGGWTMAGVSTSATRTFDGLVFYIQKPK